jgi:hypothetical protein
MTIDEIKAAIVAEKASLQEAFRKHTEEAGIECTTMAYLEGFRAWEWCLRQLVARGLPENDALAVRSSAMHKQHRLGTYGAIQDCLFGDKVTLVG